MRTWIAHTNTDITDTDTDMDIQVTGPDRNKKLNVNGYLVTRTLIAKAKLVSTIVHVFNNLRTYLAVATRSLFIHKF